MADDFFAKLGRGLKFDKRRFSNDWQAFKKTEETEDGEAAFSIVPNIDFFAAAPPASSAAAGVAGAADPAPAARKVPKAKPGSGEAAEPDGAVKAGEKKKTRRSKKKREEKEGEEGEAAATEAATEVVDAFEMEKIQTLRHHLKIHVYGSNCPAPIQGFDDLTQRFGCKSYITKNLCKLGYTEPTRIQMQACPVLLSGRDTLSCAPTGSGKTMAYLVPMMAKLSKHNKDTGVRGLLLCPTRELCGQITRECLKIGAGAGFKVKQLTKPAMAAAAKKEKKGWHGTDVLVSTPMRLVGLLHKELIVLSDVVYLVLDEADKLFELGFLSQVDEIVAACQRKKLQTAMFSATIPPQVETLGKSVMNQPIRVDIGTRNTGASTVDQKLMFVSREDGKMLAIRTMIHEGLKPPVLVFVQDKERARDLFHELVYDGINVDVIHAERSQAQRDAVIEKFRTGKIWVLICTELVSRGVDFKGVNMVINFDFPQTVTSYIHRIGRTGRAGKHGTAITFFTEEDVEYLRAIAHVMRNSGCDVPEWMCQLKKINKGKRKRVEQRPPSRKKISSS